jgi:hypothetical protein
MIGIDARLFVLLLALCGCAAPPPEPAGAPAVRSVRIEILEENEHFGHNITPEGLHTVWVDGCRGRIAGTVEPFVVFWVNNRIKDSPFRFLAGRTCTIRYTGELETAVMGYTGKCIDLRQVAGVEEEK